MRTLQRLTELADNAGLDLRPELYAEFKSGRPVSEKILETADKLRADLIIMGLHDSAYTGIISHLDLATTYDVVCQASSPVLTVNCDRYRKRWRGRRRKGENARRGKEELPRRSPRESERELSGRTRCYG